MLLVACSLFSTYALVGDTPRGVPPWSALPESRDREVPLPSAGLVAAALRRFDRRDCWDERLALSLRSLEAAPRGLAVHRMGWGAFGLECVETSTRAATNPAYGGPSVFASSGFARSP